MNELTVFQQGKDYVISSLEVAEMVEINHKELMRNIRRYVDVLSKNMQEIGERNFAPTDFFIKSSYITSQNKELPCYLLTKKGCDMVANKLTGEKGIIFTAKYVIAFERMANELQKRHIAYEIEKKQHHELTDKIKEALPESEHKHFAYKNHIDLAYKAVTGKNAKQLRQERGLKPKENVMPYLSSSEIEEIGEAKSCIAFLIKRDKSYKEIKSFLLADKMLK